MSGHDHCHSEIPRFRLPLAVGLTLALVLLEVAAGLKADSLALLTDAAHNFTDAFALVLTWYALYLERHPAHAGKTFGYHRAGILVALANSSGLALIAAGIFHAAYQRFQTPPEVQANLLVEVGSGAFVVNLVTAWLVGHGVEHDLNLRSAFLHLLGDVFSTLGAVFAGLGILLTGKQWLDPLASVLIGLLILWNAWLILRETVEILLEGTPRDIEMSTMLRDLMQIDGVRGVHDLHVWSLSRRIRMLSAHVVVDDMLVSEAFLIQRRIEVMVSHRYGVGHSTLQIESERCEPDALYCDMLGH
jgi:cobalt-zinc-cadmium efflux system protein